MLTLWLFKIAMENGPFIDGLPINNGDFPWLYMFNNQMVKLKKTLPLKPWSWIEFVTV